MGVITKWRHRGLEPVLLAVLAMFYGSGARAVEVAERLRNDPMMMPFYTGKILPTPQQVSYSNEFLPLAKTGIWLGRGLDQEDQRVNMLRKRITQYGGNATFVTSLDGDFETCICLGDCALAENVAAPEREEAYVIRAFRKDGKNVVVLKGHDARGLLWSIASLNQLITSENGICVAQKAEVSDYPTIKTRGFVGGSLRTKTTPVVPDWPRLNFTSPLNEYIVAFKMNKVCYSASTLSDRTVVAHSWKADLPEVVIQDLRKTGAFLTPLGIEWYVQLQNLSWTTMDLQVRSKNEEDFQAVFKKACAVMDAGGSICVMYDDLRFDLSPDDVRDFKTAREADIYFLNKLHSALQAKYPGKPVKMIFCPPFYWGPDAANTYAESREEYLAAIGERLPKDIGIFWTGGRVKTGRKSRESVEWYSRLIRRKPLLFQNTTGTEHAYYFHYFTDPIPAWRDWHYEGFFDDIDTFMANVSFPSNMASQLTLADFLWNPKAYDPDRSVEEAVKKLCGVETFPLLVALNKELSYFDQFDNRVTPNAARSVPAMETALAECERLWGQAQAAHPGAVEQWCGMGWCIHVQKTFVETLKAKPDLSKFAKKVEESSQQAAKECRFDAAKDTFLSAYDFTGGHPGQDYATHCEKRLATWIYGARTNKHELRTSFVVDPWPAAADYQLIISGQSDDLERKCRIRIRVNDKTVFEGGNPFVRRGWSTNSFTIPGGALKRNSMLTIQNIEDSDSKSGPPWFMVNYAVVRNGASRG